jgi:hypothetical protein
MLELWVDKGAGSKETQGSKLPEGDATMAG